PAALGGERRDLVGQVEREGAALARRALDADLAAEQPRELAADGEPEPGAAVLPAGSAVGLLKGLEDEPLLLRRDADAGVDDGEGDALAPGGGDVERDPALLGELEGVGEQVLKHLLQAR